MAVFPEFATDIRAAYNGGISRSEQNELVVRAQAGDTNALHDLIHSVLPLLLHKTSKRFGPSVLMDVVQDCVLRILVAIDKYKADLGSDVLSYLSKVIDNFLSDWVVAARPYDHNWHYMRLPYTNGRKMMHNWDKLADSHADAHECAELLSVSSKMASDMINYCQSVGQISHIDHAEQPNHPVYHENETTGKCLADLLELVDTCFTGEYHTVVRALVENGDQIKPAIAASGVDREKVIWYKRQYKKQLREHLRQCASNDVQSVVSQ